MGVSIYWRPVNVTRYDITPGARSSFVQKLEDGLRRSFPMTLGEQEMFILEAMKARCDDDGHKESLQSLIDAIQKHEEIEVFTCY